MYSVERKLYENFERWLKKNYSRREPSPREWATIMDEDHLMEPAQANTTQHSPARGRPRSWSHSRSRSLSRPPSPWSPGHPSEYNLTVYALEDATDGLVASVMETDAPGPLESLIYHHEAQSATESGDYPTAENLALPSPGLGNYPSPSTEQSVSGKGVETPAQEGSQKTLAKGITYGYVCPLQLTLAHVCLKD